MFSQEPSALTSERHRLSECTIVYHVTNLPPGPVRPFYHYTRHHTSPLLQKPSCPSIHCINPYKFHYTPLSRHARFPTYPRSQGHASCTSHPGSHARPRHSQHRSINPPEPLSCSRYRCDKSDMQIHGIQLRGASETRVRLGSASGARVQLAHGSVMDADARSRT